MASSLRGIYAAVLTPYADNLSCDVALLSRQCCRLLDEGCHGVSLFGTTGEGPALSVAERCRGLEFVREHGISADRLLPATGAASLPDTVELSRHALSVGCRNLLVMPPFFFKGVPDEGVYRFFAELADRVGDGSARYYLYNFPAVTGVAISRDVVGRLRESLGAAVAGVKDSSGEWAYLSGLIADHPGMAVFTGWETLVRDLVLAGGSGNISGMANIIAPQLRRNFDHPEDASLDRMRAALARLVAAVSSMAITPALKELTAHLRGEAGWRTLRPPLEGVSAANVKALQKAFDEFRVQAGS
jgi:4-hydroxy-tetrahydrodipicolinate synthase